MKTKLIFLIMITFLFVGCGVEQPPQYGADNLVLSKLDSNGIQKPISGLKIKEYSVLIEFNALVYTDNESGLGSKSIYATAVISQKPDSVNPLMTDEHGKFSVKQPYSFDEYYTTEKKTEDVCVSWDWQPYEYCTPEVTTCTDSCVSYDLNGNCSKYSSSCSTTPGECHQSKESYCDGWVTEELEPITHYVELNKAAIKKVTPQITYSYKGEDKTSTDISSKFKKESDINVTSIFVTEIPAEDSKSPVQKMSSPLLLGRPYMNGNRIITTDDFGNILSTEDAIQRAIDVGSISKNALTIYKATKDFFKTLKVQK